MKRKQLPVTYLMIINGRIINKENHIPGPIEIYPEIQVLFDIQTLSNVICHIGRVIDKLVVKPHRII